MVIVARDGRQAGCTAASLVYLQKYSPSSEGANAPYKTYRGAQWSAFQVITGRFVYSCPLRNCLLGPITYYFGV